MAACHCRRCHLSFADRPAFDAHRRLARPCLHPAMLGMELLDDCGWGGQLATPRKDSRGEAVPIPGPSTGQSENKADVSKTLLNPRPTIPQAPPAIKPGEGGVLNRYSRLVARMLAFIQRKAPFHIVDSRLIVDSSPNPECRAVGLSTHVLDAARGCPAAAVAVAVHQRHGTQWQLVGAGATDADGRYRHAGGSAGRYHAVSGQVGFYPEVSVVFEITGADLHYHVPLLLSPFAYSTYRGS